MRGLRFGRGWVLAGALAALAAPAAQAGLKYRIQDLGTLQGGAFEDVFPSGLNNDGVVVGTSHYDPGVSKFGAFVWERGRMRALVPITTWDLGYSAAEVNDAGVVVGEFFSRRARGIERPALFRDGGWVDVGAQPGIGEVARARDINQAGQVVGMDNRQAFFFDGTTSRRLPLTGNIQITEAVAVNDHGLVAGINYLGGYNFFYDSTRDILKRLPQRIDEQTVFEPVALNNAGQLLGIGSFSGPGGTVYEQPYIYAGGRFEALGGSGQYNQPAAINDAGWVVGTSITPGDPSDVHPFLWRNGVHSDLNDLIAPAPAGPQWELMYAEDINERGQIVGYGHIDGSSLYRGFLATPVPEGGTAALTLAGLTLLGGWLRRHVPVQRAAPDSPNL